MKSLFGKDGRGIYFVIAAVVLVLDQATKHLVHAHLRDTGPVSVIPDMFSLWYSRNPGGLFGYFRDLADPWRIGLLTLLPTVAVVLIAYFLARGRETDRVTLLALGLILGGALGNLIDRVFRGEVIDFLDVYVSSPELAGQLVDWFGTAHWPTFNVADSAIVVGACFLVYRIVRPYPPGQAGEAQPV
jgi:signal peptidase II